MNNGRPDTYNRRLFFDGFVLSMRLFRGLQDAGVDIAGCVATIGNFDGVHRGHQNIIAQLKNRASQMSLPSLAIVFEPQPLEFFNPSDAPARLMSFREKFEALKRCELDAVYCLKFDARLSQLSAQEFIERVLVKRLQVQHLVVGDDFRFGGDREGDFALLEQAGIKSGFSVENTPTHLDAGSDVRISSTEVRQALVDGEFSRAERLLGRPYSITGRVQYGQQLGRTIGFPTANIALRRIKAPLSGVFAVGVRRENGLRQKGVANIGTKPTVGQFQPNLEVHVFEQCGELYGERLTIEFIEKIREEKRFDSVDELKQQIEQDSKRARKILAH